eukprot:tig00001155_g7322.t1
MSASLSEATRTYACTNSAPEVCPFRLTDVKLQPLVVVSATEEPLMCMWQMREDAMARFAGELAVGQKLLADIAAGRPLAPLVNEAVGVSPPTPLPPRPPSTRTSVRRETSTVDSLRIPVRLR